MIFTSVVICLRGRREREQRRARCDHQCESPAHRLESTPHSPSCPAVNRLIRMPTTLRRLLPAAVLLFALAAMLTACGDRDDEPSEAPETASDERCRGPGPGRSRGERSGVPRGRRVSRRISPQRSIAVTSPRRRSIARSQATRASRAPSTAAPSQGFSVHRRGRRPRRPQLARRQLVRGLASPIPPRSRKA